MKTSKEWINNNYDNINNSTISYKIIIVSMRVMENWKMASTTGGQTVLVAKIQKGIFLWDSLLPLLFVIARMPFNYILRKCYEDYKLMKSLANVNQLIYMNDIVQLTKNKNPKRNCKNIDIQDTVREFKI